MTGERMSRDEYREVYLYSDHWHETRIGALQRAEHRCQVCNGTKQLDVHHRTYERLGDERDMDLTVLCRKCHALFHGTAAKSNKKGAAGNPLGTKKQRKEAARKRREDRAVLDRIERVERSGRRNYALRADQEKSKARREAYWASIGRVAPGVVVERVRAVTMPKE